VTLSGDLLGRTAFKVDRRRIRADGTPTPGADLLNNDPFAGSRAEATRLAASFGVKFNPYSTVLLFVNFVIPVNDTGFRDDVVFTVGGEWSF
jgi:hypothetical protein